MLTHKVKRLRMEITSSTEEISAAEIFPCLIHIQIVLFDKLRDDRYFTIGEISPLLQDRASIRFYEELCRICFRQFLVTCVYVHGFDDAFGSEVEIMIRNSVSIILRHATPPKTADSFCTGSGQSAVQWHPYLFLSVLRLY